MSDGRNPYEVFRARKRDQEILKQKDKAKQKLADRQMAIAKQIIADDEYMLKKDIASKKEKEYRQNYLIN